MKRLERIGKNTHSQSDRCEEKKNLGVLVRHLWSSLLQCEAHPACWNGNLWLDENSDCRTQKFVKLNRNSLVAESEEHWRCLTEEIRLEVRLQSEEDSRGLIITSKSNRTDMSRCCRVRLIGIGTRSESKKTHNEKTNWEQELNRKKANVTWLL